MLCKFIVFVSLITADLLSLTDACCDEQGVKIFEADLTSGISAITMASGTKVSWLKTLGTNRGSLKCNLQGVVRITFPSSLNGKQNCRLKFDLLMLKDLSKGNGWNFDISDSTNNGWGGDAGHSSNSAEVHNRRDSFLVYSNNLPGYGEFSDTTSLLADNQDKIITNNMTITVGDEYVHFDNQCGSQRGYRSPYLFTLNGQATTYGTPDYDIYFSMNRVVYPYSSTSRTGTGLCKAVIRAVDCGPPPARPPSRRGPPGPRGPPGARGPA